MADPTQPIQLRSLPAARTTRSRKRRWPRILLLHRRVACGDSRCAQPALESSGSARPPRAALPVLDGDIHLASQGAPTLSAPVTVRRDQHGVPHIDAATQEDLFVAQGYVTAQDRLWQMDAFRRNANGELAEIMGPSLVSTTRRSACSSFATPRSASTPTCPPHDRARLDAYARGVNLYIAQHQDALPPEFKLLHYQPAALDRRRLASASA